MARKKTKAPKTRTRRTPEQQIRDLEAKIAGIKERAERKKIKKDPALRHVNAAARAIDKALAATTDAATKKGLTEARATLAAVLSLNGVVVPKARRAGTRAQLDPDAVLGYLKDNPASSGPDVAEALGTDVATLRPVMKRLIAEGEVATRGKARGTRYALA